MITSDNLRILASLLFAETKDLEDAENIASVVLNRMKRPKRFGDSLGSVIFAPNQFTGVNKDEWNKAFDGKMTADEEKIYKQMVRIAGLALSGKLEDKTGGADHYYNPKIAKPDWGQLTSPDLVKKDHFYYKNTIKNSNHSYFKETLRTK